MRVRYLNRAPKVRTARMSTAVLEHTVPPAGTAAELEWAAIRRNLTSTRRKVLLAAVYDDRGERGRVHILSLNNLTYIKGKMRRFVPGVDTNAFSPFPAESAFCRSTKKRNKPSGLPLIRLHRARAEERLVGPPTCVPCLNFAGMVTGLSIQALLQASRDKRNYTVRL